MSIEVENELPRSPGFDDYAGSNIREQFNQEEYRATDAEIMAWAKTHDLLMNSLSDLRCMFDDARAYHLLR